MVWWGICTWLCYKFPTKSKSKRILKIDQYLMIYGQELAGVLFFLTHSVYLWACVYQCVSELSVSVTSGSSIETDERIELIFLHWGFLWPVLFAVLQENSGIFKNKGASLPNFVHNSGLSKFRHHTFIVATCYQQRSLTVELCWSHLRRSTRRACTLNRIVFATRPSVVRQGIARESEARSVCISQVFVSQETFSGDENTETLSNTSTWKRFRIIRLDREPV